MNKNTNTVMNSPVIDYSWANDSGFIPPPRKEGAVAHATFAPASDVGDLKTLLEEFLSTLISTVKASAGIVRISPPPHGQIPRLL